MTGQEIQRTPSNDLALPGTVTETSLQLRDGLTFDEWEATGSKLGQFQRAAAWWIGDWLNYGERCYGETYAQGIEVTGLEYSTLQSFVWVSSRVEMLRRRNNLSWSHHREVAALEPDEQDEWLTRAETGDWSKAELRRQLRQREIESPPLPEGRYQCIVIDPPWPVEKIVREVRHQQGPALDYPVMPLERIAALPIPDLAADGCHIYLWVTHKFLPAGLELLAGWDASYECSLTWVKPVGMTPFSWMYNTEHVLFARIGSLPHGQPGLKLAFDAATAGHSTKPDEFYDRVIAASPAPRLEMFARTERDGFTAWGNEVTVAA